jgi:hypothetical protein
VSDSGNPRGEEPWSPHSSGEQLPAVLDYGQERTCDLMWHFEHQARSVTTHEPALLFPKKRFVPSSCYAGPTCIEPYPSLTWLSCVRLGALLPPVFPWLVRACVTAGRRAWRPFFSARSVRSLEPQGTRAYPPLRKGTSLVEQGFTPSPWCMFSLVHDGSTL